MIGQIAVCDYVLTDPLDPSFREVTTHLSIYMLDLSGSRRLYRHFLRLPDGAVCELFGNMSANFGLQSKELEGMLLTDMLDTTAISVQVDMIYHSFLFMWFTEFLLSNQNPSSADDAINTFFRNYTSRQSPNQPSDRSHIA